MRLRNAHLVTFRLCKILHGWKVTGWAFLSGERGREEKHALKVSAQCSTPEPQNIS